MRLPKFTPGSDQVDYLDRLIRVLEQELTLRPARQRTDGALYLSGDVPLRLISPDGSVFEVTVDNTGALVTSPVTL